MKYNFFGMNFIFVNLFFTGLLTVEPSARLRMSDLERNPWLCGKHVSSTPLMTPDVLNPRTEQNVNSALSALHKATKQGFRLQVSMSFFHLKLVFNC